MTRYFMTISEAVQLVLQAATLASDGEIYILKMGKPISVKTLAKTLIMMSGQRPGHDVPIHMVGIRPGEKLNEQLCHDHEELLPTEFERVYRVESEKCPRDIEQQISRLEHAARERLDGSVLEQLRAMPIDFHRSEAVESAEPSLTEIKKPNQSSGVRGTARGSIPGRCTS